MRNNIPIIITENDINLRLIRFLIIIEILAYTTRGKLILNLDKLTIFDFLIKYPYLLKQVLAVKNKTSLKLLNIETGSVSSLFPNKITLLDIKLAKELSKLMIAYNMIDVVQEKNELFYILTEKGKTIVNRTETDYTMRIKELCNEMLILRSVSTSELKKIVNPLVKGI
ncbi:ABC-three component system middle component 4 [Bacillus sp. MSP13]|uniref:ABC-three component system middle component 4 n=1 Tax=Bacillus sp. MSP13 TaxID=1071061 RepID=UPI00057C2B75|nr:ABC-three component system middle component 4 [Bacillus sp. MSP13]